MLLAAPFLSLVLLATDGGSSVLPGGKAAAGVEAGDPFDFRWAAQVEELGWRSSKDVALARFRGLRAAPSGELCIRRGEIETCLFYDSDRLQWFEMRFRRSANVLASIRARWGEPFRIEPALDVVSYEWRRPEARVTVEEHVESAGMGTGSLAVTGRVVFEAPLPPLTQFLGPSPARAGSPPAPLLPATEDAGPSGTGGSGPPLWEPATEAERDVATAVLARVVREQGGRVFCVFRRVLVVEVEDGASSASCRRPPADPLK